MQTDFRGKGKHKSPRAVALASRLQPAFVSLQLEHNINSLLFQKSVLPLAPPRIGKLEIVLGATVAVLCCIFNPHTP